jgi:uncharacterized protein YcaQ
MHPSETLSPAAARRIALGAQGLAGRPPEAPPTGRHLLNLVERLGLHQIDSVNVLARAHYMPAFSRLGPYDPALLDDLAWGPRKNRRLFEYWAHEASLLPLALQPMLRWRMARAERGEGMWKSIAAFAAERREEIGAVLKRIEAEGPLAASDFPSRSLGGWWGWSDGKRLLEYLFWAGRLTTSTRKTNFERVYDLPERVLPSEILDLPTPHEAEARRALVAHAARAHGIATATDLRDYFRLSPAESRQAVDALVEQGELIAVRVRGWKDMAYLHRDARRPRRATRQALLSPFDPLVWERSRTERLFGMRYRIEIYTPAHKRVHGYYVLPFLLGDRLAARVDLKAERKGRRLRVEAAHAEPGSPPETAERLAETLRSTAQWLGLDDVVVARKGDLAESLAVKLRGGA